MDSMGQVEDVNEEIRRLKAEGKSLRAIATALGVSHVAVLKRLKTMEIDREMVTNDDKTESVTKEKETLLTASNSRHSRESRGSKKVDNQVVTQRTLSPAKGEGGNLS